MIPKIMIQKDNDTCNKSESTKSSSARKVDSCCYASCLTEGRVLQTGLTIFSPVPTKSSLGFSSRARGPKRPKWSFRNEAPI